MPAHVPLDRIAFSPSADPANFSRDVNITVAPVSPLPPTDAAEPATPVTFSGNILRIHSVQDGHRIDEERLAIDVREADFDAPAKWTIAIDNGDDMPLMPESVRLRCWNATSVSKLRTTDLIRFFMVIRHWRFRTTTTPRSLHQRPMRYRLQQDRNSRIPNTNPALTSAPSRRSIQVCCGRH